MQLTNLARKKTLLIFLGLSTVSAIAACSSASKYTICVMDPANGEAVCNKTGNQADNFKLKFEKMENYISIPPKDAEAILQRLKICEGSRKGH